MQTKRSPGFNVRIRQKLNHFPLEAQVELTYRCGLDCIHCYCKGCEDKDKELTTQEWKDIIDIIQQQGCLYLVFTGGDPLIREDFLELYLYAKEKGFITTVFTNGYNLTQEIIDTFVNFPPYSLEITLNAINKDTYESITKVKGSFEPVIQAIHTLAEKKIPLIIKANCLKQNKDEIGKIKKFAEELLGKPADNKYNFKFDAMIYPRLNGDCTPCQYRISFDELEKIKSQDVDVWQEYMKGLHGGLPEYRREGDYLYWCSSWMNQFFINPHGKLKFCIFTDKLSVDVREADFKHVFYNIFPNILEEKFTKQSKCRSCDLRPLCHYCPVRSALETKDEESHVDYYCSLAKRTAERIHSVGKR